MLRRTLKVISVAAAIVFVPYFVGYFVYSKDEPLLVIWSFGMAATLSFIGISVLLGMLVVYILRGN